MYCMNIGNLKIVAKVVLQDSHVIKSVYFT